jgi:hypothetical protein
LQSIVISSHWRSLLHLLSDFEGPIRRTREGGVNGSR